MEEYFGSCTNHAECEAACPKSISIDYIASMNRDDFKAKVKNRRLVSRTSTFFSTVRSVHACGPGSVRTIKVRVLPV